MRRVLIVVGLLPSLFPFASADSHTGPRRPRITVMRWADPPVTAAAEGCQDGDCHQEILILKADDPDSSITKIRVWFGDGQPFVIAHTYCVQGKRAGKPARLEIGVSYLEAGTYEVEAVAYSHRRCRAHTRGDNHPQLHSRIRSLETEVLPAE